MITKDNFLAWFYFNPTAFNEIERVIEFKWPYQISLHRFYVFYPPCLKWHSISHGAVLTLFFFLKENKLSIDNDMGIHSFAMIPFKTVDLRIKHLHWIKCSYYTKGSLVPRFQGFKRSNLNLILEGFVSIGNSHTLLVQFSTREF